MRKLPLDFRKTFRFICKNIMSKVILKYQVSMLTCPSVHPTYPKIDFRIMRTVNRLSQLNINRKFQKYISVSICHFTEYLLWDLSSLHLKAMIGVISWYVLTLQRLFHFIACVSFLSISFLFLTFSCTLLLAEVWR